MYVGMVCRDGKKWNALHIKGRKRPIRLTIKQFSEMEEWWESRICPAAKECWPCPHKKAK